MLMTRNHVNVVVAYGGLVSPCLVPSPLPRCKMALMGITCERLGEGAEMVECSQNITE
jgi:hypothetical protein